MSEGIWVTACSKSRHPLAGAFSQLLIGLINGSFYALLSLGLANIFNVLNIINFTHGAQYMLGRLRFPFAAHGIGYWPALSLLRSSSA
jgi:branched-subunit amino acid ABC-type transport system permease component